MIKIRIEFLAYALISFVKPETGYSVYNSVLFYLQKELYLCCGPEIKINIVIKYIYT